MKKFSIDWHYIKKAMIVFAACILVSASLLAASQVYLYNAKDRYNKQNISRLAIEEDGKQLEEDIRLAKLYTRPFNTLMQNGFIGDERRLDWVETLLEAAESINLNKANYRIEPRSTATLEYIENTGNYAIYVSKMNIQLELLHEGDLLYVINSISKKAPGTFHIESCNLERKQEPFVMRFSSTNLYAECSLAWYTLDSASQEYVDEYE